MATDNPLIAGVGALNTTTKNTTNQVTKLTEASALSLLNAEARSAGFTGEITKAMVTEFMNKYNAEAAKQMAEVEAVAKQNTTIGASVADLQTTITKTMQTQFPSYFDAQTFASDYIWSKVDFTKTSAGGKALDAITKVRQIVDDSGNTSVSLIEMQNYARQIGKGTLSVDGFTAMMNKQAMKDYPQLAERLADTPGATVKSLVDPYISSIAKVLEVPKDSIELSNQYLQKAIRPDGTAGKLPMLSIPDFEKMLMDSPDWQKTKAANDFARNAATSLGKALGAGI